LNLSIEHFDWVTRLIQHARDTNPTYVAAEIPAENEWVHHVNKVADRTLYARGNSWHQGDVNHTAQASMPRDVGSRRTGRSIGHLPRPAHRTQSH
jgi:hypothetical protein